MEQWYRNIISGQKASAPAAILRVLLRTLGLFYGLLIRARNFLYDYQFIEARRLPVPVISIGNITTGGTGKTPTVIMVVRTLRALGHRPAVLTRGYGSKPGQIADEVQVMRNLCPDVPVVVNSNRYAGGLTAIQQHGADCVVLDDGFQHRRLHRDFDIVLVDATQPLGIPAMLPGGTLREPPQSLARAHAVMLTRCEQISAELADFAAGLMTNWVHQRLVFQQYTTVKGVTDRSGAPVVIGGQNVLAFAGIGNPEGFLATIRTLGLVPTATYWFPDHHPYNQPDDQARLMELHREFAPEAWVTTAKDAVKLTQLQPPVPLWKVDIEANLAGYQQELFTEELAHLFLRFNPAATVPPVAPVVQA
ncbi:MAG: tetraacyldisaccharide 4'-kinase [Phycisphaerae bacterium]